MKRVHAPHLGRTVALGGRKRPAPGARVLRFREYLKGLPTPPASCDYTPAAASALADVYGNDALGDCVIAGYYHVLGVASGNATAPPTPFVASQAQIVADYSAIGGYVPGDPSTDGGCDEIAALDYWKTHDAADGSRLAGYVALDPCNQDELRAALWLFENHYFGIELPGAWISPFPSGPGFVWDVAGEPGPEHGHCVMAAGYDAQGVKLCTWGLLGTLTWGAIAKYCTPDAGGAVYALLTPDQIACGKGASPNGVDWTALQADLAQLAAAAPTTPELP